MDDTWKEWFLQTWEENRRLTNKVAHALRGRGKLDDAPVQGMRSFQDMLIEIFHVEKMYIRGLTTGEWNWDEVPSNLSTDATATLEYGRNIREETKRHWSMIDMETLLTKRPDPFFGGPDARPIDWLQYTLENEIHHRGQAYVYFRILGLEAPVFYDRSE